MTAEKLQTIINQGEGTRVEFKAASLDLNRDAFDSKNPVIAKFFREIGWVDELGSGVRNTFRYADLYSSGAIPSFIEGDVFEVIVPLTKTSEKTSEKKLIEGIAKSSDKIIKLMHFNRFITIAELAEQIEISERSIERNIAKLQLENRVERKGSARSGYWQVIDE